MANIVPAPGPAPIVPGPLGPTPAPPFPTPIVPGPPGPAPLVPQVGGGAAILGPWGGFQGGSAFDDGWNNGGVSRLVIYYDSRILNGFRVVYGNGTTVIHGSTTGTAQMVDFSGGAAVADISITVGYDFGIFAANSNGMGVLAMGVSSTPLPPQLPPVGNNSAQVVRPQILGFFGRKGSHIDSLGFYISDPRIIN